MYRMTTLTIAVCVATATWAATARAVTTYNTTVNVFETAVPQFIAGSGIPINGFAQDHLFAVGQTQSVAIKARDRDTGQANYIESNRYYVDPGYSTTNPAVTNLAIDFQFDPGDEFNNTQDGVDQDTDGTPDDPDEGDGTTNFQLRLMVDFDPAYGATDFATIHLPIFDANISNLDSWDDSDGYFINPGGGAWNASTVPYVISNTTRMDFTFWSAVFGKSYDPNAPGEYELRLQVFDPNNLFAWASVTGFAVVVPEPATMAMAGIAAMGLGLVTCRRRM